MAWVRPSRSSPNRPRPRRSGPGQEGGVAGNSGGAGGSSLPAGGSAALGGGDTGLGRRRETRAPRDQCHQPAQIATYPSCRRGFRPLPLASAGSGATGMHQGRCCRYRSAAPWSAPTNQCLQRAPKELLVALGSGADAMTSRSAAGHGGDKAGWREPAEMRQGKWMHRKGRGNGPGPQRSPADLAVSWRHR